MSKFNTTKVGSRKTINHEGGKAYTTSPEEELYMLACTSLMEDKFYEKKKDQMDRLKQLIKDAAPEFTAKLIIYVREKMYLRSITHVMAVEFARAHKGFARGVIARICQRADDMTEILAYQLTTYGKPIPNQIKKGLAIAFEKFDEYKLAKYNRKTSVQLKDVIFLTHVKASELTKKVIDDTLETPYTWETEISASTKDNRSQKWEELVASGKLGYMALLRNLRNIMDSVGPKTILKVAEMLTNEQAVKKSKQLPFRFWSAYKAVEGNMDTANARLYSSTILEALETAAGYATHNLKLAGSTFIASDVSGSMQKSISANSQVQLIHIGLLLSGIAKIISPISHVGIFGDNFKAKQLPARPFEIVRNYKEGEVGYSTEGWKAIQYLIDNNFAVDNIMLFTDEEMYGKKSLQDVISEYKKINPEVKIFIFNLGGYSTLQCVDANVYNISGWSDHIFTYIEAINKPGEILDTIRNYV